MNEHSGHGGKSVLPLSDSEWSEDFLVPPRPSWFRRRAVPVERGRWRMSDHPLRTHTTGRDKVCRRRHVGSYPCTKSSRCVRVRPWQCGRPTPVVEDATCSNTTGQAFSFAWMCLLRPSLWGKGGKPFDTCVWKFPLCYSRLWHVLVFRGFWRRRLVSLLMCLTVTTKSATIFNKISWTPGSRRRNSSFHSRFLFPCFMISRPTSSDGK